MTIVRRTNNRLFPNVLDNWFNHEWPAVSGINDGATSVPAVNIKETENSFALELAAPGFDKNDLKVDVEENVLTLSAETKTEKTENTSENYTRREFNYSSFKRSFTLPETVDMDNIDASFNNGVLHVSLPKKAAENQKKLKQITIK